MNSYSIRNRYKRDYLLTSWCRVLLEKLTGLQLVKKFPPFHGTWRFITALKSVRHLSLSWASPIQYIYPHPSRGEIVEIKLRKKSSYCWSLLRKYITMHGPQNVKFVFVVTATFICGLKTTFFWISDRVLHTVHMYRCYKWVWGLHIYIYIYITIQNSKKK